MLPLQFIRDNPDKVKDAAKAKGFKTDVDRLLAVDGRARELKKELDALRAKRNELSAGIPKAAPEAKPAIVAESKAVGERIKALEADFGGVDAELSQLLLTVPNIPAPGTPVGTSDKDNAEVRKWGEPRKFDFKPKDHVELAAGLGLVNFEGPRRFMGARSYALTGDGAWLELAVLRFVLERIASKGFIPVVPPVIVRESALTGTGFFPFGREDTYHLEKDDLFLVGTSEVSLVSLHAGEVLQEAQLPIRYAGLSTCFRREAGAHGKDTKGFYRVNQFQKVEQVSIVPADDAAAEKEHFLLLGNSEEVLQALGLPHRVALACTAELGMGQVRKHEVETWMPSRNAYSETHSCSTLTDFQARRSNIRYRAQDGSLKFAYTLNNTAIASPRILIPLLENFQEADGSVTIPAVLRPYMGGRERLVLKR